MRQTHVERSVVVPADVGTVWGMITRADRTQRWWGRLERDFTHIAQELTVSTGSASQYRLWVDVLETARLMEFTSAYLRVSPISRVRIEMEPVDGGVLVRVGEALETGDAATVHQAGEL